MTGDHPAGPAGRRYDVAVVGAGPAGLAAAVTAARAGCRVVLLDSAPRLGGRYWHHRDDTSRHARRAWSVFAALRASLLTWQVDYRPGVEVRSAVPEPGGFTVHTGPTGGVAAQRLVFATGAYDRSLPFPGWDLPGVVTPGAAYTLLSGSGVAVGSRVVVAGTGPFLLPVATALLDAGVQVAGVYEAGAPLRYAYRPGALAPSKLREAAGYAGTLARHRVPYRSRHAVVAAWGTESLSSVDIARLDRSGRPLPGIRRSVECDAAAVGYGFTPHLQLPLALGCATTLDVDGNLVLDVDVAGRTTVPGVYAGGEVTGVGGADLALVEGRLIGAVVALAAGRASPYTDQQLDRLLTARAGHRRFAALMHEVHAPPAGWQSWVDDTTVVCRCAEVPAGAVRAAARTSGAAGAGAVRQRCGAGAGVCQGRVCGYATAALTAGVRGRPLSPADLLPFAGAPAAPDGHP